MYRPEGLKNPYEARPGNAADLDRIGREIAFEAGADAMLSAIVVKLEDAPENSFVMAYVGEDEPYESTIDPITIRGLIDEFKYIKETYVGKAKTTEAKAEVT